MKTIETISNAPFRHLVSTIGELPTSFTESMSYYELLAWLCNYIEKTVIPAVNNNAEAVKELQDALVELKAYVDNYFDNLDVQDEIDHKLDEMATDGTLANIINQEIFGELNSQIESNTEDIQELSEVVKSVDFSQIQTTQTIIKDFSDLNSMQGCCVDNNNTLYQYVAGEGDTGKLKRFDLINHSYTDEISDIKFYHGNDLTYKDGRIWAAANTPTKIVSYNISSGTLEEYTTLMGLGYANLFGICDNKTENELLVAFHTISPPSGYSLNYLKIVKFNYVTLEYEEYTINNSEHQYPASQLPVAIERIENKLYVVTASTEYLLEYDIDDENYTMNLKKVYTIGVTDEIGLRFGEIEGLSILPSEYYGKFTMVMGAYTAEDDSSASTFKYYLLNPHTDIKQFTTPFSSSPFIMREYDVHVSKTTSSSGNWLVEDGSSSYPFRSLGRAIEFASNNKVGIRIGDIIIDDNSTYNIGQLAGVKATISCGSHTPTFNWKVSKAINSDVAIRGAQTKTIDIKDSSLAIINSNIKLDHVSVNKQISLTQSSLDIIDGSISTPDTVYHAIVADSGSTVKAKLTSISGFTGNAIMGYNGSYVQINSTYSDKIGGASGTVVSVATT